MTLVSRANGNQAFPRVGLTALVILLALSAHFFIAACVAVYSPFPSSYDEIAHLSYIKAMAEHPALFPLYGTYRLIDAQDFSHWTNEPNYLAHPSLYYLLLAPIWIASHGSVLVLRCADVLLSSLGLALTAAGGAKIINSAQSRLLFVALVFCFPKNPVIGGIVSNDNLALLATGIFFWGLGAQRHATAWLCLGLIIAGWTKLTALVGLGSVAGFLVLWSVLRDRRTLFSRAHLALAAALLFGLSPYLVNWARTGHLLYEPQNSFWIIPQEQRPALDVFSYLGAFLNHIVAKFPAADRMMDDRLPLLVLLGLASLGLFNKDETEARKLAMASLAALAVFLPIHFLYSWQTFVSAGQMSDAQPRYYNELWPGFALALALACTVIDRKRWPLAGLCTLILCLLPTAAGLVFFQPPAS